MVCLGFKPGTAQWKAHTNPLSYGGTPTDSFFKMDFLTFRPCLATVARRRIFNSCFSVAQSVNSLVRFFAIFIDSVFGLPNLVNVSLERKLQIERARWDQIHEAFNEWTNVHSKKFRLSKIYLRNTCRVSKKIDFLGKWNQLFEWNLKMFIVFFEKLLYVGNVWLT